MENSMTQVSNGFIHSVRINRMMSPSDADDLGHPITAYLNFRWFTDGDTFLLLCNFV